MIISIRFVPKFFAESLSFTDKDIIISIGEKKSKANLNFINQPLYLSFQDTQKNKQSLFEENFNFVHLNQITQFINYYHSLTSTFNLTIHCEAGVSRSPAIALYAHHLTKANIIDYEKTDFANTYIIDFINKTLNINIIIPPKKNNESSIILF